MQTIPIALATTDMVLARDVKRTDNPAGPPICGKGMTLNESLLERLKTLGIKMITVEGHPVWMEGDKTLPELLDLMDRRFRKVSDDPLMNKLKELYRVRLIRSMGQQDAG